MVVLATFCRSGRLFLVVLAAFGRSGDDFVGRSGGIWSLWPPLIVLAAFDRSGWVRVRVRVIPAFGRSGCLW